MRRVPGIGWVVICAGATAGWAQPAQEIYVFTGEHGEVTFSDVAGPGAERVEVAVIEPPEDAQAELDRRIARILNVANALEASRLAREQARADAREQARAEARAAAAARPPPEPQIVYRDRYLTYPYVFRSRYHQRLFRDGRFRHRDPFDKRPHGKRERRHHEPAERMRSPAFLYAPD
jgi:hypothetical protein